MPVWMINLLISLAVKWGLPWLLAKFPLLPPWLEQIIEKIIEDLKQENADKKQIIKEAHNQVRQACSGSACPTDLVKD